MNILRTVQFKDSWYALPPEKRSEIMTAAVAFHEKYIKSGKLKNAYTFADGRQMMTVWNVGSMDELMSIVSQSPHATFVNSETAPVLDHQEVVTWMSQRKEAARTVARDGQVWVEPEPVEDGLNYRLG